MIQKTLILVGVTFVITGAILKILHVFEPWNNIMFNGGIGFSFAYFAFRFNATKNNAKN